MSQDPDSAARQSPHDLEASFLRARKEMWVMLGAWAFFFLFVTVVCATLGGDRTDEGGVPILFGLPRWVVFGIVAPWLVANAFIYWFSFHFMQDTPLGEEE